MTSSSPTARTSTRTAGTGAPNAARSVSQPATTVFPGARQVFRLRRGTGGVDGVRTSKQIIYGIVSQTTEQADTFAVYGI